MRRWGVIASAVLAIAAGDSVAHAHHHFARYGAGAWGSPTYISSYAFTPSPIIAGSGMYGGTFYPPPVFLPADLLYGPGPVLRMMGLAPSGPTVPFPTPIAQPAAAGAAGGAAAQPNIGVGFGVLAGGAPPKAPIPAVRISNRQSKDRAYQIIAIGDDYFHKQRYSEAYQRYKDAAVMAPDLADIFFREGLALTAFGRWELAAQTIRRGLKLDASWPRSNFRLDTLFGNNKLAKTAQWETLAQAAAEHPHNGDLLFLIGVQLYFDGQAERSKAFFERAKAIDPSAAEHVQVFLDALARPAGALPGGPRQI
ncbi:MAG TPA: tetratricopeptide repeat protein [Pirellulales bacterium]|jgi:Tfp pilus assembly protein PilF|nr:tetratricopeptide repeat protein [Pirellulales bacterium]